MKLSQTAKFKFAWASKIAQFREFAQTAAVNCSLQHK